MDELLETRIPLALAGAADKPWVETDPGQAWSKLLWADLDGGGWASLLKWKRGYVAAPHVHLADAHFLMLTGKIKVRDTVYGPGEYGYEPAGAVHGATTTLEDSVSIFFISNGRKCGSKRNDATGTPRVRDRCRRHRRRRRSGARRAGDSLGRSESHQHEDCAAYRGIRDPAAGRAGQWFTRSQPAMTGCRASSTASASPARSLGRDHHQGRRQGFGGPNAPGSLEGMVVTHIDGMLLRELTTAQIARGCSPAAASGSNSKIRGSGTVSVGETNDLSERQRRLQGRPARLLSERRRRRSFTRRGDRNGTVSAAAALFTRCSASDARRRERDDGLASLADRARVASRLVAGSGLDRGCDRSGCRRVHHRLVRRPSPRPAHRRLVAPPRRRAGRGDRGDELRGDPLCRDRPRPGDRRRCGGVRPGSRR